MPGPLDHVGRVLDLFEDGREVVTPDDVAAGTGLARSGAYRVIKGLQGLGLLDRAGDAGYALGPRVVALYRQLQLGNPLLSAARPVMLALAAEVPPGSAILLCRSYQDDRVMCVHQEVSPGPQAPVSYQVGRPMPLYRGSSSLAVLAGLPRARLARLWARDAAAIQAAGLGATREAFLAALRAITRAGYQVSHGAVDRNRIGVSAPFQDERTGAAACISLVLSADRGATRMDVDRGVLKVVAAADRVASALREAARRPPPESSDALPSAAAE